MTSREVFDAVAAGTMTAEEGAGILTVPSKGARIASGVLVLTLAFLAAYAVGMALCTGAARWWYSAGIPLMFLTTELIVWRSRKAFRRETEARLQALRDKAGLK